MSKYHERWYIRYCYPDGRIEQIPEQAESSSDVRNVAIASGLFIALGAGLGAAVGLRMSSDKSAAPVPVSVARGGAALAAKALAYGTVLAFAGTGAVVFVTCKVMGVSTFKEFGDRMRNRVPEATKTIGPEYVRPFRKFLEDNLSWMKRDSNSNGKQ